MKLSQRNSYIKKCSTLFTPKFKLVNCIFSSLDKRSIKYVKKWTEKLWSHTSQNGLFITVWPGNKTQNAFVGISLNKAKVPILE